MGKRLKFLRSFPPKRKNVPAKAEMQRQFPQAENAVVVAGAKGKKKTGSRLWMRFDRMGQSELIECDKATIMRRVAIPARDLRILGPVFSHSSNILEKWLHNSEATNGLQSELPFEFQVLEIALEVVCTHLDSNVAELEREAYPLLDELARNVNTKSLERVRSLKSVLTRLLARVQKVRDELEHLLDDNEDMAYLYLTRRHMQNQQLEGSALANRSNSLTIMSHLHRAGLSNRNNGSIISGVHHDDDDVEDLEMLLEAYFMQLDGTHNKILSVREYIDDTEDYVNIQLDNQRNELIQLQLILTIASFAVAVDTLIASIFGMNIPCTFYNIDGIFWPFVGATSAACVLLFLFILGYGRWKRLIGV